MKTKKELIEKVLKQVKNVDCNIVKVYGVPCGIGYDMIVKVELSDGRIKYLETHAGPRSWTMPDHLRKDQIEYDNYKGKNPPLFYADVVKRFWSDKQGLKEYLQRFKKETLITIL